MEPLFTKEQLNNMRREDLIKVTLLMQEQKSKNENEIQLLKDKQKELEVCDVASSAYLPHSGKSRLGCEAGTVMKFVFIPFVYCWRAGSD